MSKAVSPVAASQRFLNTTKAIFALAILAALSPQTAAAQDYLKPYQKGIEAYQQKDYPTFLSNFKDAYRVAPHHLTINYYYAAANALTGNPDKAFELLQKLANLGADYGLAKSETFASLRDDPRFGDTISLLERNTEPVSTSSLAFRISERTLLTEGIAFDPRTESFYVSSVHRKKIVRIDQDGNISDFISEGQDGIWGVLAIVVDAERRHLWATTALLPQMKDYQEAGPSPSGAFKYLLDSGELVKKYIREDSSQAHNLNDLTLAQNGDVFITDAAAFELYKISQDRDELQIFLKAGAIPTMQGIAFSRDGRFLFVASYRDGVYRVDVNSRIVSRLEHPANTTLYGIDGLYFYKNTLVAIHNGLEPHRIMRHQLSPDYTRVIRSETIERANPEFDEPTLGVLVADEFYYIANSQWGRFAQDGSTPPAESLNEPMIMRVKLN